MTIKDDELTANRLRVLLSYDPDSGVFRYLTKAARRVHIGQAAGSINNEGYRYIRVDGRAYRAHRLAWLYMYGRWPQTETLDHINGCRDDNRIANIRHASRSQNMANSRPIRTGKQYHKGTRPIKGRWSARIQKDGTPIFLGTFETEIEAVVAYAEASDRLFGSFSRASS